MFLPISLPVALLGSLVALILYQVGSCIYNIWLHPLRNYPGPLLWRMSKLPWCTRMRNGTLATGMLEMHEKYGPVVRIAPGELSFNDPDAWKDIHGHKVGSTASSAEMKKSDYFYQLSTILPRSLINEDRDVHSLLRRGLSHGFSEKSMREQEPIINQYADTLMSRLRESCVDPVTGERKATDMTAMYNYFTFDVIGDLAFGEPFGCLKNNKYHPWVKLIFDSIRDTAMVVGVKYLGFDWIVDLAFTLGQKKRAMHAELTQAKLKKRMEAGMERPDLIEGLLKKRKEWGLSMGRLSQNASVLIVAGSETTATVLSGVTYHLCKNPSALEKLKEEVRSAFKSEDEITFTAVSNLPYMLACLSEALRSYPPIPGGLPRDVPKGGAMISGNFVPENTAVSMYQWSMYHNSKLWKDPFGYHPERFLGDPAYAGDRKEALQPFSIGPRNCIGKNLAYAEMRLVLARVIYNFDMEIAEDMDDWLDQKVFVLWEKRPLKVYLTPVRRD